MIFKFADYFTNKEYFGYKIPLLVHLVTENNLDY